MGYKQSYSWRSIWNSRSLLKVGLVWRVGNGDSNKIWNDKWIMSPTSYAVQSLVKILGRDARVKELIDEDTKLWKITLLKEISNVDEEAKIRNLAIILKQKKYQLM